MTTTKAEQLAAEWQKRATADASRRNSAYDYFGMDNTPESVDPLGAKMAAELRRLSAVEAERDALLADAERWRSLYYRAVNEANGLTNYVEERPELRRAERQLEAIQREAGAIDAAMKGTT